MSRHNPILIKTFSLIEPVCNSAGYELVDMRFTMEHGGWTLRVCIDLLAGTSRSADHSLDDDGELVARIDTSDCERASREISAVLDVEDPIPQAYSLEVSSPGIDRPLRTPAHFASFVGSEIKLTLAVAHIGPQGAERRNFRGVIQSVKGEGLHSVVELKVDGAMYSLRIDDVDQARLLPDWDVVMRGKSTGVGKIKDKDKGKATNAESGKAKKKNRSSSGPG